VSTAQSVDTVNVDKMKRLICFLLGHNIVYIVGIKEPIDLSNAVYIHRGVIECIFCKRCGYKIYSK